jgi:O-antigen/teichoic acid export membrane protein
MLSISHEIDRSYQPISVAGVMSLPVRSLRSNFFWTLVGNFLYAGCQWGMLVAIAKFGSPEAMGQFGLGLAIGAPIIFLFNMQMRTVAATDARHDFLFRDYLSLRLLGVIPAFLVIAGVTVIAGYHRQIVLVVLALGLCKAIESISDIFYGLFQQHERLDRLAISMLIKGPLSLIALSAGLYLTGNIFWGVIALAVVWLSVLIGYDLPNGRFILKASGLEAPRHKHKAKFLRLNWSKVKLTRLMTLGLPLGVAAMLNSLNNNIPLYFIQHFQGERAVGIFVALAYLMVAGSTTINAMGQPINPRLAKYFAGGQRADFRQLLIKFLGFGVILGGLSILCALIGGHQILSLFYGAEYAEHVSLFFWLMVAASVTYVAVILNDGMMTVRCFSIQLPLNAVIIIISTVMSFWLIPIYGLYGAVMALICARATQAVCGFAVIGYALVKAAPSSREVGSTL